MSEVSETRGRGRPATGQKATKNITVDADIQDALNEIAGEFESRFGFRPTLSQTIRHLINEAKKAAAA